MKPFIPMLAPALLLGVSLAASPCDLKTVTPGHYCMFEDMLLGPKDLVSNQTYYACEECEVIERKEGVCPYCEQNLAKKTSGPNVCKHCFHKPSACEVCAKVYFECAECGVETLEQGECSECNEPLAKREAPAVIEYRCPECFHTSLSKGKCEDEECDMYGEPLVRACSQSGVFPHVGPKGS